MRFWYEALDSSTQSIAPGHQAMVFSHEALSISREALLISHEALGVCSQALNGCTRTSAGLSETLSKVSATMSISDRAAVVSRRAFMKRVGKQENHANWMCNREWSLQVVHQSLNRNLKLGVQNEQRAGRQGDNAQGGRYAAG